MRIHTLPELLSFSLLDPGPEVTLWLRGIRLHHLLRWFGENKCGLWTLVRINVPKYRSPHGKHRTVCGFLYPTSFWDGRESRKRPAAFLESGDRITTLSGRIIFGCHVHCTVAIFSIKFSLNAAIYICLFLIPYWPANNFKNFFFLGGGKKIPVWIQ